MEPRLINQSIDRVLEPGDGVLECRSPDWRKDDCVLRCILSLRSAALNVCCPVALTVSRLRSDRCSLLLLIRFAFDPSAENGVYQHALLSRPPSTTYLLLLLINALNARLVRLRDIHD